MIARTIEAAGVATTSISIAKDLTAAVGVPRAVFVKWPLGHPLGEAGNVAQQRTMVFEMLKLLVAATEPGQIAAPNYRWRREAYREPDWSLLDR